MSQSYIYARLKKIDPLVHKIFHFQEYDLENEVKVTKIYTAFKYVTVIFLCQFEENPSSGPKDIHLTRL